MLLARGLHSINSELASEHFGQKLDKMKTFTYVRSHSYQGGTPPIIPTSLSSFSPVVARGYPSRPRFSYPVRVAHLYLDFETSTYLVQLLPVLECDRDDGEGTMDIALVHINDHGF